MTYRAELIEERSWFNHWTHWRRIAMQSLNSLKKARDVADKHTKW